MTVFDFFPCSHLDPDFCGKTNDSSINKSFDGECSKYTKGKKNCGCTIFSCLSKVDKNNQLQTFYTLNMQYLYILLIFVVKISTEYRIEFLFPILFEDPVLFILYNKNSKLLHQKFYLTH